MKIENIKPYDKIKLNGKEIIWADQQKENK